MQPKHKKILRYTRTRSHHRYTCPRHTLPTIITTPQQKMPAMRSLTHQPNHAHTDAAHNHARGLVQQPPCSLCPRGCCATTMHPRDPIRLPPETPTSTWPMSTCSSRHISPAVGSQDDHRSSTQSRRLMTRPPDAQARARLALLRSMPPSCPSPPLQASIASSSTTRCRDGDRDRPTICCVGHPRHRRPPVSRVSIRA